MHDALIAVHQDRIAVQRLGGDALAWMTSGIAQARATIAAWLPTEPSSSTMPLSFWPYSKQFAGADIARDKDRVVGHVGAGIGALSGQDAQQPVGQIVQIMQPFAQVGVC